MQMSRSLLFRAETCRIIALNNNIHAKGLETMSTSNS